MIQTTYSSTGGCFVHRPISTQNRLILPFTAYECCKGGPGLCGENRRLPKELEKLGVRDDQWNYFMEKLDKEVQRNSPSLFFGRYSFWFFALIGLLFCHCRAEYKYNRLIGKWLEEFNGQVLNSLGLYAKIQTNHGRIVEYTETISWLAFSLNEEETIKLKKEPVLWCKCCCSKTIKPSCIQKMEGCCGPERNI